MQARGRSRQISTAAEARKASEERLARRRRMVPSVVVNTNLPPIHHAHARSNQVHYPSGLTAQRYTHRSEIFASAADDAPKSSATMRIDTPPSRMPSASSSSSSLSSSFSMAATDPEFDYFYCDSPPSPPHTIEDQLHVAYAHDDIHLAKILLLKLKGIEVSSDDDPRIAAVQEEDFDMCFLPHGALLTDEEEQKAKEAQRVEHEKRERQMWERRCQRIWENEKLRLREEKLRIQTAKIKAEEQRRRQAQHELETRHRAALKRSRKPKLSYSTLASGSSSSLSLTTPPLDLPPRRARPEVDEFDSTIPQSSVTFEEVLSSMNGALFPTERGHARAGSSKSISTLKRGVKPDPLDVLLDPDISHYEPGQRRRPGLKASPCLLCSRTNSLSSSISSPISATSDDSDYSSASFSSFSSSFSDITTPSTSPESTSNVLLSKPIIPPIRRLPTSCHCRPPPTRLVAVTDHPLAESPLPSKPFASPQSPSISRRSSRSRQSPVRSRSISRLGRFLELAKSFQHAYMHAMVYSVMPTVDYADVPDQRETKVRMRRLLKPEGYRATAELVNMFISEVPPEPEVNLTLSMYVSLDGEPRTVLPYPLPYKTHFEPEVGPLPSPMQRFFHQKHLRNLRGHRGEQYVGGDPEEFAQFLKRPYKGTGGPQSRLRIIQNPMYMHLKAVRGAVALRGESLDSPGLKKGPMANGTEKMLGFTTEWNRRSLLCPDTRL